MNYYSIEIMAKQRTAELLRDAEQDRRASEARLHTGSNAEGTFVTRPRHATWIRLAWITLATLGLIGASVVTAEAVSAAATPAPAACRAAMPTAFCQDLGAGDLKVLAPVGPDSGVSGAELNALRHGSNSAGEPGLPSAIVACPLILPASECLVVDGAGPGNAGEMSQAMNGELGALRHGTISATSPISIDWNDFHGRR